MHSGATRRSYGTLLTCQSTKHRFMHSRRSTFCRRHSITFAAAALRQGDLGSTTRLVGAHGRLRWPPDRPQQLRQHLSGTQATGTGRPRRLNLKSSGGGLISDVLFGCVNESHIGDSRFGAYQSRRISRSSSFHRTRLEYVTQCDTGMDLETNPGSNRAPGAM